MIWMYIDNSMRKIIAFSLQFFFFVNIFFLLYAIDYVLQLYVTAVILY
jgi:hypothetical protein